MTDKERFQTKIGATYTLKKKRLIDFPTHQSLNEFVKSLAKARMLTTETEKIDSVDVTLEPLLSVFIKWLHLEYHFIQPQAMTVCIMSQFVFVAKKIRNVFIQCNFHAIFSNFKFHDEI